MVERTAVDVKQALDDLVKSDGWAILQELIEYRFGHARQLSEIDAIMRGTKPADLDDTLNATIPQIRAAAAGAQLVLSLVEHRRKQADAESKQKPTVVDRFKEFRRA